MLTRIYRYRIRPGSEAPYLRLQEDALALYRAIVEVDAWFLRDAQDPTRRTEVLRFTGPDAQADLARIDADPRVRELFARFQGEILDPQHPDLTEETLVSESLSAAGKPHHIEIYCSDLARSESFWSWFLGQLGYAQFQKWATGVSFGLADTYIVFVQADAKHLAPPYHRCRPGLNHLAFHATSRRQVDTITAALRERGCRILYEDRHPHAAGPHSYAVFFEDPERIKVELVAP